MGIGGALKKIFRVASGAAGGAGSLVAGAVELADRLHTSEEERSQLELERLKITSETERVQLEAGKELALNQSTEQNLTNREEIKRSGRFDNWRSTVGMACACGVFFHYVFFDFAVLVITVLQSDFEPPLPGDPAELMILLGGLLGLSGIKTYERVSTHGK